VIQIESSIQGTYITCGDIEDAVLGFLQSESDSEIRFAAIMGAFRRLASARRRHK